MHALAFHNTQFDITDRNGQPWLRSFQIGSALGYKNPSADMAKLYDRNADEFTSSMTALVELDTAGGKQQVRIFSLRGVHLLAMLSRTKVAKEFRHWVLDVLEGIAEVPASAKAKRQPKALPNGLSLDQQATIKGLVKARVEALPKDKQAKAAITCWSALKSKFGCTYKQIEPAQFTDAVSLLARVVLEGELLAPEQPKRLATLPAPRKIRSRDDLSFTQRDAEGRLINWHMPHRANNWHEHYGIGETWFNEIIELARHNPREAYYAMKYAGEDMVRYWNKGHVSGFFDRMAQWALTAILNTPDGPRLPFTPPNLGIPPREGMEHYLAGAVPHQPLTPEEQEAVDAQAWQEAAEVQRHWFQLRRQQLLDNKRAR